MKFNWIEGAPFCNDCGRRSRMITLLFKKVPHCDYCDAKENAPKDHPLEQGEITKPLFEEWWKDLDVGSDWKVHTGAGSFDINIIDCSNDSIEYKVVSGRMTGRVVCCSKALFKHSYDFINNITPILHATAHAVPAVRDTSANSPKQHKHANEKEVERQPKVDELVASLTRILYKLPEHIRQEQAKALLASSDKPKQ